MSKMLNLGSAKNQMFSSLANWTNIVKTLPDYILCLQKRSISDVPISLKFCMSRSIFVHVSRSAAESG